MEAYVRQKRAQPGMVLANDMMRPSTATATGAQRVQSPQSPHAYDGPLQFTMSAHNPDQLRPASPGDCNDGTQSMCNIVVVC